jgi:putative ATP-dependent endonuclease of OLD family
VPFSHIQKLKPTADGLKVHRLNADLLQKGDLRKIEFHLRLSRPNALFARAWLLVEGETEIWLFNELAQQLGYHFLAEGIQVMPFAQSGLKPLINIAQQLGIEWHVLTDGDFAGKQYANTVKKILLNIVPSPPLNQRLTILPAADIEHFLFYNGFESVFRSLIHAEKDQKTPNKKLLMKAVKRHAKPDIALAVVQYAQQLPEEKLPVLLRWVIKRIVNLARG